MVIVGGEGWILVEGIYMGILRGGCGSLVWRIGGGGLLGIGRWCGGGLLRE